MGDIMEYEFQAEFEADDDEVVLSANSTTECV